MLTEVPSEGATINLFPLIRPAQARSWTDSAFTPAGRSSIDEFIFMFFNNILGDRLDR
jgi:hypothetical protein